MFPPLPVGHHLDTVPRAAIITLFLQGKNESEISSLIPCSLRTVKHWLTHYNEHNNVNNEPRCGRPSLLDEVTKSCIINEALNNPHHSTPRQIKRKYACALSGKGIEEENSNNNYNNSNNRKKTKNNNNNKKNEEENESDSNSDDDNEDESINELAEVSLRTIRRTLDSVGILGRVAVKEPDYTEEHIRKRLSFANGYAGM